MAFKFNPLTGNLDIVGGSAAGYVPYTGATDDVDLGNYGLNASGINTGALFVRDSVDAAQALQIKVNENLTADRVLNLIVNDADKTLTIAADATISGTNTGDANVTTANEATDTTCFLNFTTASGSTTQQIKTNPALTYNSATNTAVLNIANSNVTDCFVNASTLTVDDAGASGFALRIRPNETLSADRILNVLVNGANRSLNLTGNITTAANFTTSGAFALTLTQTGTTNVTLPTSGTLLSTAAAVTVAQGGTGQTTYTDGQLLIGNTSGGTLVKSTLTGTANQVTVTNGAGSITLSLPQDIATTSSPQFLSETIRNGTTADTYAYIRAGGYTSYSYTSTLALQAGVGDNTFDEYSYIRALNTGGGGASRSHLTFGKKISGGGFTEFGRFNNGGQLLIGTTTNLSGSILEVSGNISAIKSSAGVVVTTAAENTDSVNSASDARLSATVNGGSAGDPYLFFNIGGVTSYSKRLDNSDGDKLKESFDSTGATPFRVVTTSGEQTLPLQPAFLATNSAEISNVTGAGAAYNLVLNSEIYDQNSDYNTATGVFTAPITGKYQLCATIYLINLDTSLSRMQMAFVTSNRTYYICDGDILASSTILAQSGAVIADMDAGDTAYLTINGSGMAGNTADLRGAGYQYFSGFLLG